MADFKLSLSDYAALVGIMLAVTGTNILVTTALIEASEARVSGAMDLNALTASTESTQLSEDFVSLSADIREIVQRSLEARTNEILLSLTSLGEVTDEVTFRIVNVPVSSELWSLFSEFAQQEGNFGSAYEIGNIAYGSVRLASLTDEKALTLQNIISQASNEDMLDVRLQFDLSQDSLLGVSGIYESLIMKGIDLTVPQND